MTPATSRTPTSPEVFRRIRSGYDALTPELQRAAQWVVDHPGETGFLSMRQQARSAGVSAPTMVRLARALGFSDYASLRRPFQDAMAGRSLEFRNRASALQSAPVSTRPDGDLGARLARTQQDDVNSVQLLNPPERIDAVAATIRGARRVGFLGVRASFGIAFHFRYAYNMIARNGVLFDGLAGTVQDQVDALEAGDVMIAISQAPYSMPTVQSVHSAVKRGVTVVALTDSALSPLAKGAKHTLLFRADSVSFFHSMIGPLALVELLLAQLAAKGGRTVLKRLAEVEDRLTRHNAYWQPIKRSKPG